MKRIKIDEKNNKKQFAMFIFTDIGVSTDDSIKRFLDQEDGKCIVYGQN